MENPENKEELQNTQAQETQATGEVSEENSPLETAPANEPAPDGEPEQEAAIAAEESVENVAGDASDDSEVQPAEVAAPEAEATPVEEAELPADDPAMQPPDETIFEEELLEDPLMAVADESDPVEDEKLFSENIRRILDIELPVTVCFGSAKRPLSEVLKLGPGALLELDRVADEPVVLKVNNKIFAKAEVVEVDGYYGVEIIEIDAQADRIATLGDLT